MDEDEHFSSATGSINYREAGIFVGAFTPRESGVFSIFSLYRVKPFPNGFLIAGLLFLCACASAPTSSSAFRDFFEYAEENYPNEKYLRAIGDGKSAAIAQEAAHGGIAKIFSARIEDDLLINQNVINLDDTQIQSGYLSRSTLVSARTDIKGIEVPRILYDEVENTYYALAVLDREEVEQRWQDELRQYRNQIAAIELEIEQPTIAPYQAIHKLRELHQAIENHNQLIGKLRIVNPAAGYVYKRNGTAQRLKQTAQTMSFSVIAEPPELQSVIISSLAQQGMPARDAATAKMLIEAEVTDLPQLRQDEWFISRRLLTVNITYDKTRHRILKWQLSANSIHRQEAWSRLQTRMINTVRDDFFVAIVDELNGE